MAIETMLTTIDNPYSPFDEYPQWHTFDVTAGYQTAAFIARLSMNSEELSDSDRRLANELIIEEILRENVTGMFVKVTREVPN